MQVNFIRTQLFRDLFVGGIRGLGLGKRILSFSLGDSEPASWSISPTGLLAVEKDTKFTQVCRIRYKTLDKLDFRT